MKNKQNLLPNLILLFFFLFTISLQAQRTGIKWSTDRAWNWYNSNPWICGFNYIPANAINYTAMWEKSGFSPDVIDKELALAAATGFNAVRVVLQFIVWEDDPMYFKDVFAKFLSICKKHGLEVMPALFDDCAFGINIDPSLGKQPEPLAGWYAWAWSPSPGRTMAADSTTWFRLEKYVKDIIGTFKKNSVIMAWDLYNEPRNTSLPLVRKVFKWAREINPTQPLTVCIFGNRELQDAIVENSDIITFHNYSPREPVEKTIQDLKKHQRPIICTEWLNRPRGSIVEEILPLFFEENIGCFHWGLVNGKTQTDLPWGHRPGDMPYRGIWQHDLYTSDFKMYSSYEIQLFKNYISKSKTRQIPAVKKGK